MHRKFVKLQCVFSPLHFCSATSLEYEKLSKGMNGGPKLHFWWKLLGLFIEVSFEQLYCWKLCDKVHSRSWQKKKKRRHAKLLIIGSAEALPILCVRCARCVRERERERKRKRERYRERERERDGSDVTIVVLKLAMSFALFLAKNLHLSFGEDFSTFLCQIFAP